MGVTHMWKNLPQWWKTAVIVGLLVLLPLTLSACAYPGQDPPCTGARANEPGCANPAQDIKDDKPGGAWYVDWAFDIIRRFLSSVAITAVQAGVGIFWGIFKNLSSTDFAACGGGSGGNNPTCAAYAAFEVVRPIAYVLIPAVVSWKFFKSYFVGAFIENFYESALSFLPRIFIGAMVVSFLEYLIAAAFGLSNVLFETVLGSPKVLSDLSVKLIGNGTAGVGSVGEIQNLGLLLFLLVLCLLVSAVFILLGIAFFLRTIIAFLLFVLAPLAIIAGLTEELRDWFKRWLDCLVGLLIAPIPVAISLALVNTFVDTLPSAKLNPPEFMLRVIYVIAFLAVGAILMFKIAAQAGGLMYGLVTVGISSLAGFAAGRTVGALGSAGNGNGKNAQPEQSPAKSEAEKENTRSGNPNSNFGGNFSPVASSATFASAAPPATESLNRTLRGLQESFAGLQLNRSTMYSAAPGENVGRNVARNVQSGLMWAGQAAGVNAPYFYPATGTSGRTVVSSQSANWQSYDRTSLDEIELSSGNNHSGGGGEGPAPPEPILSPEPPAPRPGLPPASVSPPPALPPDNAISGEYRTVRVERIEGAIPDPFGDNKSKGNIQLT
jgi:hypothetical protein